DMLTIGLGNAGARDSFTRSGADEVLRQALIDELGADWKVEATRDTGPSSATRPASERPPRPRAAARPPQPASGAASAPDDVPPPDRAVSDPPPASNTESGTPAAGADHDEAEVSDDDTVVDDGSLSDQELLARELGAEVIEDIRHDTPGS